MAVRKVYQFRAELFDYEPLIWRRFQVTSDITLSRFCYILMTLFEMEASHLFKIECPLNCRLSIGCSRINVCIFAKPYRNSCVFMVQLIKEGRGCT